MSSQSRAAQEKLAELENVSAPYEHQLLEAAKFIGVDLYAIGKESSNVSKEADKYRFSAFHAREEWLLRWLLKKLQSPKDNIPRTSSLSWRLLRHSLQSIPLSNASRILNERKFMTILQQTVYDVQMQQEKSEAQMNYVSESSSTVQEQPAKVSKKRKRSGELVKTATGSGNYVLSDIVDSIFCCISDIIAASKPIFVGVEGDIDASFSAECIGSVIRTSGAESAKILGSWLAICEKTLNIEISSVPINARRWLSPFLSIWESHAIDNGDTYLFSQSCANPLLSLLRSLKESFNTILLNSVRSEWLIELEQFVARHIIIPARATGGESGTSDFDTILGEGALALHSDYAPILFDIAIRLLTSHASRKWRPQDEKWLQATFATFKDAISSMNPDDRNKSIYGMLESVMRFKLDLDLSMLKSIALEYALLDPYTDWKLLAMVMRIDINTFLIPNDEDNILENVLRRVTKASLDEGNMRLISKEIVPQIIIPLMRGFSKARDLSGFIRHWFFQTVALEQLRKKSKIQPAGFGVWEDEDLQDELSELFEASLTLQQIDVLLDWLCSQALENIDAVCLILDAVAGSIRQEEVVDHIGLRLYHIIFDGGHAERLTDAYKWRSWRILSKTLGWISGASITEFEDLWERKAKPFDQLSASVPEIGHKSIELEPLEHFKCLCACWDNARAGAQVEQELSPLIQKSVGKMSRGMGKIVRRMRDGKALNTVSISTKLSGYLPGELWAYWSLGQCIFTEHPKALELCSDSPDDPFKCIMESMLDLATFQITSNDTEILPGSPQEVFSKLWLSILSDDCILNNQTVTSHIIDVLLSNITTDSEKDVKVWNKLSAEYLLRLPLEAFSKRQRERILGGWLPRALDSSLSQIQDGTYASVLSLKVKILQRPTAYKDMKFEDLVQLGMYLTSQIPQPRVILSLYRELARLTLSFVATNMDQTWNREYMLEAIQFLKKRIEVDKKSVENDCYTLDTLAQVVATTLISNSVTINKLSVVSTSEYEDIISTYRSALLSRLKSLLHKPGKYDNDDSARSLLLLATLNALETVGVDEGKLSKRAEDAQACVASMNERNLEIGRELGTFMAAHTHLETPFQGLATTTSGRKAISVSTLGLLDGLDEYGKLQVLQSLLEEAFDGPDALENLLAARQIIASCQDVRRANHTSSEEPDYDLSETYSQLCSRMWKTTSVRQFCLITEIMEVMLRIKGRALSQWNIDGTLGSVAITCSRNGPSLNSSRAGTIYLHLCRLVQVVLTNHRLKIEGHFHLVVQTMQSLLRCFFAPLPYTNKIFTRRVAPPPWLSTRPQYQLTAVHGAAYTRLLTLICNPSVSTVTHSQHNPLTSATDKAKRIAGQHMQFVLATYIKLQLEMRMKPEVREKMVPGLYAIFDTTTVEMRRMIGDGLDSSGRALLGTLVRDYRKFGKWKGG
ncbi:Urb2/Npa2 family-domain-containing protein [Xylogone sp. PMI_703]|nr:Urb2/Npa2 family-domain-containing protein [Xylogone sp. PMI_703]